MPLLIAAIAAVAAGPALVALTARSQRAAWLLDGLVVVAIGGLVAGHTLPHAIEDGGWAAAGLALFALAGPGLLERLLDRQAHDIEQLALALALGGVLFHAMLDGAAISGAGVEPTGGAEVLGLAIVLHRFPEGMGIWWLVVRSHGPRWALVCMIAVALATVAGYGGAASLIEGASPVALASFRALVAGSLLHVIVHHRPEARPDEGTGARRLWTGAGGGIALSLVIAALELGPHASAGDLPRLVLWPLRSLPVLLLGYVVLVPPGHEHSPGHRPR
jgi:zinc transporter ZupT